MSCQIMCLDTHKTKNNTTTKHSNPCQNQAFFYIKEVESTDFEMRSVCSLYFGNIMRVCIRNDLLCDAYFASV